jgi:hypothetical protein
MQVLADDLPAGRDYLEAPGHESARGMWLSSFIGEWAYAACAPMAGFSVFALGYA